MLCNDGRTLIQSGVVFHQSKPSKPSFVTARNLGGKVEEGVGRITGDKQAQLKGKLDQLAGTAQDLYGHTL